VAEPPKLSTAVDKWGFAEPACSYPQNYEQPHFDFRKKFFAAMIFA
jgi:hypothetical protein